MLSINEDILGRYRTPGELWPTYRHFLAGDRPNFTPVRHRGAEQSYVPMRLGVFLPAPKFASDCGSHANDLPECLEREVGSISSEIGYLDLTPDFMNAAKRGALPYYPGDEHWSPEGHEIAAEEINNDLLGRGKDKKAKATSGARKIEWTRNAAT
jgi:hypothetical protein